MAVDVGQAALNAIMVEGQSLMVDTEQVQNGGVKVVPANAVFLGAMAGLIRVAVGDSGPQPCPSHPHGKSRAVVVATETNFV